MIPKPLARIDESGTSDCMVCDCPQKDHEVLLRYVLRAWLKHRLLQTSSLLLVVIERVRWWA